MGEIAPLPRRGTLTEGTALSVLERVERFQARVLSTISPPFMNPTGAWLVIIRGEEETFRNGKEMMDELEHRYPAPKPPPKSPGDAVALKLLARITQLEGGDDDHA